jgi:hypothetical protein
LPVVGFGVGVTAEADRHPFLRFLRLCLAHKVRRRHLKSIRKSLDCREGWVSLTAFDASDEGAMHSGGVGELLL